MDNRTKRYLENPPPPYLYSGYQDSLVLVLATWDHLGTKKKEVGPPCQITRIYLIQDWSSIINLKGSNFSGCFPKCSRQVPFFQDIF